MKCCDECAPTHATNNTGRASGELPADAEQTERWLPSFYVQTMSQKNGRQGKLPLQPVEDTNKTPDDLLAGVRRLGTMGLPHSSTQARPRTARLQRTPRERTGLAERQDSPSRSRRIRRIHDVSTSSKSSRCRRRLRGSCVPTQGPAPFFTNLRFPRSPRYAPHFFPSTLKLARTPHCSRLILRTGTYRRRRDRAFQKLHFLGARGTHQHEGFPPYL